jgi:hypothetical protein
MKETHDPKGADPITKSENVFSQSDEKATMLPAAAALLAL